MSESPHSHLDSEEFRALLERCRMGEEFVFTGEKITVPASLTGANTGLAGGLFEVSPDELIDVAKHLNTAAEKPGEAIERAYSLICEAHVFSRNLKHWNDKSKRGHVSQTIHDLVESHVITDGARKGKVPRIPLLQSFLKDQGLPTNKTDVGKLFSRWVREALRLESFKEVVPWRADRKDFDKTLCETLYKNGWIRWVNVRGGEHLVLPATTDKPSHKPRARVREGDHETRPWWTTKTTWWPNPTKAEQMGTKSEHLCDNSQNFHNAHTAKKCLTAFELWLEVERRVKEEYGNDKKAQKIDPKTGHFR